MVGENTFGLGGDASTTNQRMEIRAALEAVRALPRPLTVWSAAGMEKGRGDIPARLLEVLGVPT